MNIVFTGNFLGLGWDGSITDEIYISEALEGFGHTVWRIDRTDHSILPAFEDISFVLISQYDQYPIDWIPRLKEQYKCPVILWSYDFQEWGQEWHERLVEEADLYLSKRIADSKYPNWQWLSQDFAPSFLHKATRGSQFQKDIDILFTGTYLPWATERNEILKAVDEQYDLHIYSVNPAEWLSAGFKHVNGPIMDEALPALITRAKINLSIDHTYEAGYWSDRNAQIMCCGGFVLFRHVPLSTAVFRSNIGYFYDIESCFTSLDYWLEADEDRENLAGFGYDFAHQDLTVKERVSDLLNIVQGIL